MIASTGLGIAIILVAVVSAFWVISYTPALTTGEFIRERIPIASRPGIQLVFTLTVSAEVIASPHILFAERATV
ncbi:hypothetical protein KQ929_12235 [Leclercia pneumoniae]|uniref:Uncharacterized protein n=1 Tax=Leclercia pneumoniae TaxID=2815358 RepID=A0ABX8JNZ6_9ENTR|nr:hypothetical protein [Leclercia pneumoniae]QSW37040.1 hypothetical protein JZ655_08280 [Leclercia pneumoniae]QWW78045.1 hypothetical protein KQ929_12235 [Leclercia pneumoniae]